MMADRVCRVFLVLALASSTKVLAGELCDLYKLPGDCLRQPSAVLEGLNFASVPYPSMPATTDVLREHSAANSLGLWVRVVIKDHHICAITYGTDTGRYTVGADKFADFKGLVERTYNQANWTQSPAKSGVTRIYDDGETRVTIGRGHVMFQNMVGCGFRRPMQCSVEL